MAHFVKISARTKAMKKAGSDPVVKSVQFPNSISEIKAGIGPWKTVQEMFRDAKKHRVVIIQSKMRAELEGNGSTEIEEQDDSFVDA